MKSQLSGTTLAGLMVATVLVVAQTPTNAPGDLQASPGQAPEVTFKAAVDYVEEDVRVVDNQGQFIRGLRREDFQILEDGKPQKIGAFGLIDIPFVPIAKPLFAGPSALPIEPDVASNAQSLDGRLYLILLDDYHVSAIRTAQVKQLARQFILEKLGANDQAAVLVTSGNVKGSQTFTENRHLLLDAVDQFMGGKLPSPSLAKVDDRARELARLAAASFQQPDPIDDLFAVERMYKARSALSSLRNIVEWLSAIRGRRKAVVYITEGVDYNLHDMFSSGAEPSNFNFEEANIIQLAIWDTISAASRSNVQIYPIDPRGLNTIGQENIEVDSRASMPDLHAGGNRLEEELQISQSNLRQLAEETGGVATTGTNDLSHAFDRIVQENSSYYVLGYHPTNEKRDGKLRAISVKVAGAPGAQLTYRKRYAAPRDRLPTAAAANPADTVAAQLMDTMASPMPLTGLGMRVTAVPHKGAGKNADVEVLVETVGSDLKFKEAGGLFTSTLSLSIGVFGKSGKWVAGQQPVVKLPLKPETHAVVVRGGLRVLRHLEIPPGVYQVRVAAQDSVGLKQGSVHLDLEVPDFSKDPIATSGIAIASTADTFIEVGKDPFGGGLPGPPTALREFPSGDELAAFVEIYDNRPIPTHWLDISTTVKADDGRVVFTNSAKRSSDELKGSPGAFGYGVRISLKDWRPGLYVMTVGARSRLGNVEQTSRVIQFKVR